MIYTFVSSGTDNGKQFHTSEEALAYLHQVVEHSKTGTKSNHQNIRTYGIRIHSSKRN